MAFTWPDVLTQLGVATETANEYMFSAISNGHTEFKEELVSVARKLPVDVRVTCTKQLVRLLREYTGSETFARSYKKYRNQQMKGKARGFRLPKPSELLNSAAAQILSNQTPETALPANHVQLVKARLEEFLKESATVDFNAQLNGNVFANTEYERKSHQWKMYYRAGKAVIETAQAEVKAWLDDIAQQ